MMGIFGGGQREPEAPVVDTVPTGIGWRLATFALENFEPREDCLFTLTQAWDAYCGWCVKRGEEPMAVAYFDREFGRVAEAAGIERVQNGANVYFMHVVLRDRR